MPGQLELVKLLGVSRKTVELALNALEHQGLLEAQGVGRRRNITIPEEMVANSTLRVALLIHDRTAVETPTIHHLHHLLETMGHEPF